MPTPLGHALGGSAAGLRVLPAEARRGVARAGIGAALPSLRLRGLTALAAALPDVDFLWGRHNMETHSLGAAVLAGAVAWLWARGRTVAGASAVRPWKVA